MSDSYAALAELAGGFSHEIKNHLGTLGLNLQLLAEDFHDPQTQRERRALTRIHKLQAECQRLVDLSNDFLRFARIKELDVAPTDLSKVIEEMIDFFEPTAKAANIDLRTYLPADLPLVPLHRDMFKQALLNLLLNAEQAMPEGGSITFQATVAETPASKQVCLMIIDTGKGIGPETQEKIFEPFFSTRSGGSGLGLPTTKRIIEAHRGTIAVESAVGKGTKFTLRLPVAA
jgi:signal transduction histidine kinase